MTELKVKEERINKDGQENIMSQKKQPPTNVQLIIKLELFLKCLAIHFDVILLKADSVVSQMKF